MKLHLPKPLFTALLAAFAFAAPAIGLTLTEGYHKTYSLSQDFSYTDASGNVVSYSNGTLSSYDMNSKTLTLNMSTTWTTAQALFIINPSDSSSASPDTTSTSSVGLYATADGNLNAIAGNSTAWATSVITKATLDEEGSQTSITVKSQKANNFGTLITSANGNTLYTNGDLRYSNGGYTKTYLNSNIISAIVVTDVPQDVTVDATKYYASNYTGSWEQQFAKDATMAVFELSEISAETNLGGKTAIIVGNVGQLHLNASTATLSVAAGTNIYIGNTSYQNSTEPTYSHAALRFENANAVDVAGNIYLVDNATVVSTGSANITLSGQVTDKVANSASEIITTNSTLLLKGNGYNFAGGLDVTGLSLESGASVSISSAAVIGTLSAASGTVSLAENATLSLGAASHTIGTLTGGGLVTTAGNLSITNAPADFTGALKVQGSTATVTNATSDFTLKNLTLDGSDSESSASFEIVAQGTNATTGYSYNIEQLTVSGTGTLANTTPTRAPGYQSQWNIGELTNAEEGTSGVLNLNSSTKTDNRSIINLNGGDFAGEINLQGNSNNAGRKVALNVNAETAAADAVVSLSSSGQKVALGIGADRVVLKGINGSTGSIISGAQAYHTDSKTAYNGADFTAIDTTFRKLVIDTDGTDDTAAVNSSTSATLGSYLNLEKDGEGSQTFSGDLSAFNGTITVTEGSLTLGTEGQSGTMGLGGTINVSSGAALYLYNSFTIVDLAKLDTTEGVTYSDKDNGNGYAGATYILVENAGTTTVGSDITVNNNNNSYKLNAGVYTEHVTFTVSGTSGDYYVNADVNGAAVVYDTGSSDAIASDATTGIILNGGNLDMRTSLNAKANGITAYNNGITEYKAATINLNGDNVTLQQEKLTVGTGAAVTLTGSGTFDLGGLGDGVKHSSMTAEDDAIKLSSSENDGWTGTVSFSGGTKAIGDNTQSVQDINFNLLGHAGSTVEIAEAGVYGYLLKGDTTFTPNIKLSGNLILQNGYAGSTYTFNGDFSGSGNFETCKALSVNNARGLDFVFAGDMSQWKGDLVQNMKDDMYSYKFAAAKDENTTIANGIVAKSTAIMDVIVSNDNEVIMAGKLTAETGSTLKVTHEGAGNLNVKSVEVQGDGEVQVAGLHITATDSAENATMTAKADTTGALKYLAAETSFTIEDMTLLNTTITAATPTTQVKLQNVAAENLALAQGKFTMGETAQVSMGGVGTTDNDFTTSLLSGITLQNSVVDGVSSSTLVVDLGDLSCVSAMGPGKYNLSITLRGFTMVDHTQGLLFAADSWLGKLLSAQGATAYVSGAVETPASVSVSYSAATDGDGSNVGTIIIINGLNVPEPASATLGLAALMMLCARRRRK